MSAGRPLRTGAILVVLLASLWSPAADAQSHGSRRRVDPRAERAVGPPDKVFPFDNTWILRSWNGKPVPVADPPSFSVDPTLRAIGFAGCNTFSMALYPVRNQTLASGAIAMTHKTCAKDVMALEHSFLVALHSMPKWEVSTLGDLSIKAPQVLMAFRRGV